MFKRFNRFNKSILNTKKEFAYLKNFIQTLNIPSMIDQYSISTPENKPRPIDLSSPTKEDV